MKAVFGLLNFFLWFGGVVALIIAIINADLWYFFTSITLFIFGYLTTRMILNSKF